jgi:hypothetical protein
LCLSILAYNRGQPLAPELLETAHRIKQIMGQVFRYAIATGRASRDPSGDLRGALPPRRESHHAALTKPADVGGLIRTIAAYQGSFVMG